MRAIEQAYFSIKSRLEKRVWTSGERMPALAELALLSRVSRTTMWHALARLQKESLLHIEPGRAIIAGRPTEVDVQPKLTGCAWERLKAQIGRDLLAGIYGRGRLPPQNKLALNYGTAPNTLKRALGSLVAEGMVAREGRNFVIAGSTGFKKSASVVFIGEGNRDWGIFSNIRVRQIVETIELESLRRGLGSRSEYFDARDPKGLLIISATVRAVPEIAGIIVSFANPENAKLRERWLDLFRFLAGTGRPVIVVDQDGHNEFPPVLMQNPLFSVLRIAGARAGDQVAEFLLQRMERRIAFITAYPTMNWAIERSDGLRRTVNRYTDPKTPVMFFPGSEILDIESLSAEALALPEKELRALYASFRTPDEINELIEKIKKRTQSRTGRSFPQTPAMEIVRPVARFMAGLKKNLNNRDMFNRLLERIGQLAEADAHQERFRTFFPAVLAQFSRGVWVCDNDNTAVAALLFLRSKGVAVPKELSVVGFDNWEGAYRNNLTTYDFNMRGIVLEAMMMITDEKYRKSRPKIAVVDGYVVERGTTRR